MNVVAKFAIEAKERLRGFLKRLDRKGPVIIDDMELLKGIDDTLRCFLLFIVCKGDKSWTNYQASSFVLASAIRKKNIKIDPFFLNVVDIVYGCIKGTLHINSYDLKKLVLYTLYFMGDIQRTFIDDFDPPPKRVSGSMDLF